MNAEIYREAIEYELLTQSVYQAILNQDGIPNIDVKHNISLKGHSGVEHQIDVFWEFNQAGIKHCVVIECKNYSSNLTLEKARNFFAVLHDIGNCVGLIVTKTGYQQGAVKFCGYYGIGLKLLKPPTDKEWEGRIRRIVVNVIPRVPISTKEKPIKAALCLQPVNDAQEKRLKSAVEQNPDLVKAGPSLRFLDANGQPKTEEMRWWIPQQLDVLNFKDGGPYKKTVKLDDSFIPVDLGGGSELIQIIGVIIEFHVETLSSEKIVLDAGHTVVAILQDFQSGKWEHIYKERNV